MRGVLTTQIQNGYREQFQKEMLTRLAWKSRYSKFYPTCKISQDNKMEDTQLPADALAMVPPVTRTPERQEDFPLPPSPPPPNAAALSVEQEHQMKPPPRMRPVSPQTRQALYQDSSHHGKGRSLYLQRRGHLRPEEKFDYPVLSSWEYGWRLGDYSLDYRSPSHAKVSVTRNSFYARNGVFSSPSATDTVG